MVRYACRCWRDNLYKVSVTERRAVDSGFWARICHTLVTGKVAHSGFETQNRRHQKSKTGISVAPQKDMCLPKNFKKTLVTGISVCLLRQINESNLGKTRLRNTLWVQNDITRIMNKILLLLYINLKRWWSVISLVVVIILSTLSTITVVFSHMYQ